MKNNIVVIKREDVDSLAEKYFSNMCGFNRNSEKFKRMLRDGLATRKKIKDKINIRAIVSSFEGDAIDGKTINLDGIKFECNVFQRMNAKNVLKIYIYILTAGIIELKETSTMEMFFADTWGTSYVETGRDVLKNIIEEDFLKDYTGNKDIFISDSFGPGYYGMDVNQIRDFFKLLNGESIGVKVGDGGMMIPLKSCAGFFIVLDDEKQIPGEDCKSCLSNFKGCEFCRTKMKSKP